MKVKRFIGFSLAVAMTLSSFSLNYAEEVIDNTVSDGNLTDTVVSDQAINVDENNIALLSADVTVEFAGGDGTEVNPYQIATAEQLAYMHNNLSAHYILICDIDMSGQVWLPLGQSTPTGRVVPPFKDNNNFEPYEDVFEGAFNGNGYAISNLTIKGDEIYDVGLFGCANNKSVIENVQLKNVSIVANKYRLCRTVEK